MTHGYAVIYDLRAKVITNGSIALRLSPYSHYDFRLFQMKQVALYRKEMPDYAYSEITERKKQMRRQKFGIATVVMGWLFGEHPSQGK